jgi:hypothetical protein
VDVLQILDPLGSQRFRAKLGVWIVSFPTYGLLNTVQASVGQLHINSGWDVASRASTLMLSGVRAWAVQHYRDYLIEGLHGTALGE